MMINLSLNKSVAYKCFVWLFAEDKKNHFRNSALLGMLDKLSNPKLSVLFLALSFVCLWYESLFGHMGVGWVEGFNLAAVSLVFSLLFCDKKRIVSSKSITYLILFILAALVSGLLAAINGLEMGMIITGILLYFQFAAAFIIASTNKDRTLIVDMILVLSLPLLLAAVFQVFWGGPTSKLWLSASEGLISSRAYGFFSSPNVLGSVIMITIIAAIFAWFDKRKWYYLGYSVLAIVAIVLTFSRSAWFGLSVGVVTALLIANWKYIIFAPLGLLVLLIPSVKQRLIVAVSQEYLVDAAIDGRVWSMNNALDIFKTSPLLGTGPGTYGGQTSILYDSPIYLRGMQNGYVALAYTDNQWLQVLVQTGIVGIVFVGCFFVSTVANNYRQYMRGKKYFNLGVLAATVAIIVNGMFGNIWEFGAVSVLAGTYLGLGANND